MRMEHGAQGGQKRDRSRVKLQGPDPEGRVFWGRKFFFPRAMWSHRRYVF